MRAIWMLGVTAALALGGVGCGGNGGNPDPSKQTDAGADAGQEARAAGLDESRSTVAVTRGSPAVVDHVSVATVTATILDQSGQAMPGLPIQFVVEGPGLLITSTGFTDAKGTFSSAVMGTGVGVAEVSAVVNLPGGPTPLFSRASVTFVAGAATQLVFTRPPGRSLAGAPLSPAVEVSVEDAWGNVVEGASPTVTLALTGAPSLLLGTLSQEAVGGVARFDDLSLTAVGSAFALVASSEGFPARTSPTFEVAAGYPSRLASSLVAQGSWGLTANGQQPATLTLTLKDGFGNPCLGVPVTFTASGTQNAFAPPEGVTGPDGTLVTQLTTTRAELKTVTVTTQGITLSAETNFNPGPLDLAHSSFSLSSAPVVANGVDQAVLTVHTADAFDNPLQLWARTYLTDPLTQMTVSDYFSTDPAGNGITHFSSTVAGHRELTLDDPALFSGGIDFVPGPAAQLRFLESPTEVYAGEPTAWRVAVTDLNGNVVPSASASVTVDLTASEARPALLGALTRPTVDGVATFSDLQVSQVASALRLHAVAGSWEASSPSFDVHAWRRLGPNGGTIRAVLVSTDSKRILAGTGGAGIFRSTDQGLTFAAANRGLSSLEVVSLYGSGSLDQVWALTAQGGVFFTADNGLTWTARNAGLPPLEARAITRESYSGAYVLATDAGLFRSADQGASWTAINSGLTDLDVRVVFPFNQQLFAGTGTGRIFKSADHGATWIDTGVDLGGPATGLSPIYSDVLYASSRGGGLFRTSDQGATWTAVSGLPSVEINGLAPGYSSVCALTEDQGLFCSSGSAWSPASSGVPSSVRAMGAASYFDTYVLGTPRGLFISHDHGNSYLERDLGIAGTSIGDLVRDPATAGGWYVATDDGVLHSADGGRTWSSRSGGLPRAAFVAVQVDPTTPTTLYAGSADGLIYKSLDAGQSWAPASQGLPLGLALVTVRAASGAASVLYALGADEGVFKSTDGAATWAQVGGASSPVGGSSLWIDPATPSTLFVGTDDGTVLRSTDAGDTWTAAGTGLTATSVRGLWLGEGGLYAATDVGVFQSGDGGGSWTALPAFAGDCRAVGEDPSQPGRIFAVVNGGILRSDDAGATATEVGEPVVGARRFAFDPAVPGALWVETAAQGVWRSMSEGR